MTKWWAFSPACSLIPEKGLIDRIRPMALGLCYHVTLKTVIFLLALGSAPDATPRPIKKVDGKEKKQRKKRSKNILHRPDRVLTKFGSGFCSAVSIAARHSTTRRLSGFFCYCGTVTALFFSFRKRPFAVEQTSKLVRSLKSTSRSTAP